MIFPCLDVPDILFTLLVPPSAKASWVKRKTTTGWSKVSPPKQDPGGEMRRVGGWHVELFMKTGEFTPGHIFNTHNNPGKNHIVRYSTYRLRPQANGSAYATHGYVWAIRLYSTTHLLTMRWVPGHILVWIIIADILDKRPTEITYLTLAPYL